MMTKEEYTKIVNFMNPRSGGSCTGAYSENAIFLLFLSTLGHRSDILLKYVVMMTKEGLKKILNFMTISATYTYTYTAH